MSIFVSHEDDAPFFYTKICTLQVLNPGNLTLNPDTSGTIQLKLHIPIFCCMKTNKGCSMRIQMYEATKDECPVLAAYRLQNKCGVKVHFNDWNKTQEMKITMKKDPKYKMRDRIIVLQLEVAADLDLNSFWHNYKIPDITVRSTTLLQVAVTNGITGQAIIMMISMGNNFINLFIAIVHSFLTPTFYFYLFIYCTYYW